MSKNSYFVNCFLNVISFSSVTCSNIREFTGDKTIGDRWHDYPTGGSSYVEISFLCWLEIWLETTKITMSKEIEALLARRQLRLGLRLMAKADRYFKTLLDHFISKSLHVIYPCPSTDK